MLAAHPTLREAAVADLLEAIEARGYARGHALVTKWQELLARFGPR
jgi:hypothetical protein